MLMTEEQAMRKWCPMARVVMPVNQTANRVATSLLKMVDDRDRDYFTEQAENCKCVASDCAMWRWGGMRYLPGTTATDGGMNDEAHGYCGLAGKPTEHGQ